MSHNNVVKTIQTRTGGNQRIIAWNGVRLQTPVDWETRVSGQRHLVFEKDFQPQLQIRWETSVSNTPRFFEKRLKKFVGQMGSIMPTDNFPSELLQLRDNFDLVSCYQDDNGMIKGGICLCAECRTLVLFQVLSTDPALMEELTVCLVTFSCHNHPDTLWSIQDFSLTLPSSFILKDYTFGAGLTRLSFFSADLFLQTCRLAPAETRLAQQTLEEILITLTGTSDLATVVSEDNTSCIGLRNPTIPKQIVFRFRREKPFICAKIWHDAESNRLLAVVLSSNRPIPRAINDKICKDYEIIQEKS